MLGPVDSSFCGAVSRGLGAGSANKSWASQTALVGSSIGAQEQPKELNVIIGKRHVPGAFIPYGKF